jgi:membrane associated rhomboid family serine protease
MRDFPSQQGPSVWAVLLVINLAVFLLDAILRVASGVSMGENYFLTNWFALSIQNLMQGKVWTLLTYSFLHHSPLHLLGNMLGLFFLGRYVEERLGKNAFLTFYLAAALAGAVFYVTLGLIKPLLPWPNLPWRLALQLPLIGASASIYAIVCFFCLTNMERRITLLLFFVLPVTIKPKWLLFFVVGFESFGLVFGEIFNLYGSPISHSAHAGGIVLAFLYFRYGLSRDWSIDFSKLGGAARQKIEQAPKWSRQNKAIREAAGNYKVNISKGASSGLQAEVDRILDKINSEGFGSLTPEERRTLDNARDSLSRP